MSIKIITYPKSSFFVYHFVLSLLKMFNFYYYCPVFPFFQSRQTSKEYFLVLTYFQIHSTRLSGIAIHFSVFPRLLVLVNGLASLMITQNQEMSTVGFPGRISLQKIYKKLTNNTFQVWIQFSIFIKNKLSIYVFQRL